MTKFLRAQIESNAESFQHIRTARLGGNAAVAMFHHHCARRCNEKHRSCGNIEHVELIATRATKVNRRTL